MTSKLFSGAPRHIIGPFIVAVTLLIAVVVVAQVPSAIANRTRKSHQLVTASPQAMRQKVSVPGLPRNLPIGNVHTNQQSLPEPSLFQPAVAYNSGGNLTYSVTVADVNNDGQPDLLTVSNGTVGVLLGNGDGTFQPAATYFSGGQTAPATTIAVADLNNDGKLDLVVVNSASGSYGLLLGNGDGTFRQVATSSICGGGGGWPGAVAVADLNGDGKPDLIVDNAACTSSVGVFLGNGDGSFAQQVYYWSGDLGDDSIAVADLNGDGKLDVVAANGCCNVSSSLGVLLGNGDGTLQTVSKYDPGGLYPTSVVVADVNGDGKPDLVAADSCASAKACPGEGSIAVLLGNGDGTFPPPVTFDSGGGGASGVAVADVNDDGKADLLVANGISNTIAVLQGNGDGTFQPAITYTSGGVQPTSIAVADLNGDGRPDLVFTNLCADATCTGSGSVGVLLNNGGSREPTATALSSNSNPVPQHRLVTYTATVSSQNEAALTGSVMFEDGDLPIAHVPLVNNRAMFTTGLKLGTHTITATYPGDSNNTGSTSPTLIEYVEYLAKTSLSTSAPAAFVGQSVTFTAIVTSTHGAIPDGELVIFHDGTKTLGAMALSAGSAVFATSSLSAGIHFIKATYAGDATFAPASASLQQVISKYPTTTILRSSINPSGQGQTVTFTAKVVSPGPTPTGKVVFKDGTLWTGSAILVGGLAKVTKSTLSMGTHPITAEYLGDTFSTKSTSRVLNQVVK